MRTSFLYIRVSTDEQASKGYSLRHQEESLIKYCEQNDILILKTIREDYSAKTFNRPEWNNLLKLFNHEKAKRPNLILFTRWDRFSRNTGDAYYMIALLRKKMIEVQAIEQLLDLDIPENKLVLALYLAISEVENDRRALNVKKALYKARKEGRWIGPAPKGYINKTIETGKKVIVPFEPEATIIKNTFDRISQGDISIREVHRIAIQSGFKCSFSNFYCLIRNPVYCGKIKIPDFENEKSCIVSGNHEGLVSDSLFEKVQEMLNIRSRKIIKKTNNSHFPFRGILVCPKCGHILTGSISKGRKKYYSYYHCYNGCKFRIRTSKIDEQFLELLKGLNPPEIVIDLYRIILKKLFDSSLKKCSMKQNQVTKNLEHLFNRSIKAKELFLTGEIDEEDFKIIKNDCEIKINTMGKELQQVTFEMMKFRDNLNKESSKLFNMLQLYKDAPVDIKRKIIRLLLKNEIIQTEEAFQNFTISDIVNIVFGIDVHINKNLIEKADTKTVSNYDEESRYYYNELLKESASKSIKTSSIFWSKFPEITAFLKKMASIINFQ